MRFLHYLRLRIFLDIVLGVANSRVRERVLDVDSDAVAGMKGVDRIVMSLNSMIGDFGMLDYSRMSESQKWRGKNEGYRELHLGKMEDRDAVYGCEVSNQISASIDVHEKLLSCANAFNTDKNDKKKLVRSLPL